MRDLDRTSSRRERTDINSFIVLVLLAAIAVGASAWGLNAVAVGG